METRKKRIRALRAWLSAKGLDGILITSPYNRFYLSGFAAEDMGIEESAGALLLLRHQQILLTDGRYREQAKDEAEGWEIFIYKGLAQGMKESLKGLTIKTLAYEPTFISCHSIESLKRALPGVKWVDSQGFLERKRALKGNDEISSMKGAIQVAEKVLMEASETMSPGMTEREIAAWIVHQLSIHSQGPSFPPIVASGPNAALPHAVPTGRKIRKGEPVIIDMGARYEGYCSDMTRTFFIGRPDPQMEEIYSVVRRAQKAAIAGCLPGRSGREVDRIARGIIEEAGYGRFFVHGTGHGVGLAVHEAPALSSRWRKRLRPGMVVTVEPGIYLPGKGGVRLEAMVLITEEDPVELTSQRGYLEL